MSFKDIYERYLNGEATEEEIKYIEEELEKNELINDILAQKLDEDILNLVGKEDDESKDNNIVKDDSILEEVNKAVRKKLIITGLCSVLVVILLGLGSKYIVSPLMNLYYYNPTEKVGEISKRFEEDFSFFSELHYPGVFSEYINCEPLGYGKYKVIVSQLEMFRNASKIYTGEINKGELVSMPIDFYQNPLCNSFSSYSTENINSNLKNDSRELKELQNLPNTTVAKATVSFKDDVNMEKINELRIKYPSLNFEWIAVRINSIDDQPLPMLGFRPYTLVPTDGVKNDERYPDIQIDVNNLQQINSKTFERHFMSLLNYMIDNEKFVDLFGGIRIDSKLYEDALDYVYANGVKSYGIVVSGKPEDILKLREESGISGVWIDDVALSIYSK